jgi:hypothetical protein
MVKEETSDKEQRVFRKLEELHISNWKAKGIIPKDIDNRCCERTVYAERSYETILGKEGVVLSKEVRLSPTEVSKEMYGDEESSHTRTRTTYSLIIGQGDGELDLSCHRKSCEGLFEKVDERYNRYEPELRTEQKIEALDSLLEGLED